MAVSAAAVAKAAAMLLTNEKDPERFGLDSGGNLFTRHSFDRPALLPWLRRGGA